MKKKFTKILSVALAVALVGCSIAAPAYAATVKKQQSESAIVTVLKHVAFGAVETILTSVIGVVANIIPDKTAAMNPEDYVSENFFSGSETFVDAPVANAKWKLGYSYASLVPSDWKEHTYYLGGYMVADNWFTNNVEGIIDDMGVRIFAITDSDDRGISLFGTIDAIGVSNKDIREVRKFLSDAAEAEGIKLTSVNVFSTHSHSGIDTQGLWSNTFVKAIKNIFSLLTGIGEPESGADEHYLEFMRKAVADAMFEAIENMTPGTMTYSTKDIGPDYYTNKNRKSASSLPTNLNRFVFTPDNEDIDPTMIVNLGAHPDVAGLATGDGQSTGREVCGEYIYYMGAELAENGYNCMFINGAIAGIYMARGATNDGVTMSKRYMQSERYGREIGKMLLAMNLTEEEIYESDFYDAEVVAAEKLDSENNGAKYTLWCEDWTSVEEVEVAPIFNIRIKEVRFNVTNPLIAAAGKLKLANYNVIRDEEGNYSIYSEVGYLEIGHIPVVMVPGELVSDIYAGGSSLTAEGSYSGTEFGYESLCDIFGEDTICFGLANDAIGYIVPDNDYVMVIFDDHYQELISLGKGTASTMMEAFLEIAEEVK